MCSCKKYCNSVQSTALQLVMQAKMFFFVLKNQFRAGRHACVPAYNFSFHSNVMMTTTTQKKVNVEKYVHSFKVLSAFFECVVVHQSKIVA